MTMVFSSIRRKRVLLVAQVTALGIVAGPVRGAQQEEAVYTYASMLQELQAFPEFVDYTALRHAYAASSDYTPYPALDGLEDEMFLAIEGENFEGAVTLATTLLDSVPLYIGAHVGALVAYEALGDSARARHHGFVSGGIVRSIEESGSGSVDDPYVVIAVWEEYDLMDALGAEVRARRYEPCGEFDCDVFDVLLPETGRATVYFDVSIPRRWLMRRPPYEVDVDVAGQFLGSFATSVTADTTFGVQFTISQNGRELSGTVTTETGRTATLLGAIEPNGEDVAVGLRFTDGCDGEGWGGADILDDGDRIVGKFRAEDCTGAYTGEFDVARQ